MENKQELWSGRLGFILATIGSALGLGSIWKFPYEVGTNGGSAFSLLYVLKRKAPRAEEAPSANCTARSPTSP